MRRLIAVSILLIVSFQSAAETTSCDSYSAELSMMLQVDQSVRDLISMADIPIGKVKEADTSKSFRRMLVIDKVNSKRLMQLVKVCGWPKKSVQGQAASGAAWLLAQHADPQQQILLLPIIEEAVKMGDASMSDFAYLSDRVLTRDGNPQLYGTQMRQASKCEFEFEPMDDRNKVNERRKSAGMPSLEEYERMLNNYVLTQGCPAK